MRILLLGGTGAMGVHLTALLAEQKHEVFVTTRRRRENTENVTYIQGNAKDLDFLTQLLHEKWDVIVDFMIYNTESFQCVVNKFLDAAGQYIFISTSRVYADQHGMPITEESDRLLDACKDAEYLRTEEYALTKARQEDILRNSGRKNWTIIRPYITYSEERLQLGVLEKEYWLQRALCGKSIVVHKDILEHMTSLTYGFDVAKVMCELAGNQDALGECFHIVNPKPIRWKDVLEIYCDELQRLTGKRPNVILCESTGLIAVQENYYQVHYDRMYDRVFDSRKCERICRKSFEFLDTEEGIRKCLSAFVSEQRSFSYFPLKAWAYCDKVSHEHFPISEIESNKKLKYLIFRYTPFLKIQRKIERNASAIVVK